MSTAKVERSIALPPRSPRSAKVAGGALARLWTEFTDPGPSGDLPVFIRKYAAGIGPAAMGIPFLAVGLVIMTVFGSRVTLSDKKTFLPLLFGAVFALAGFFVTSLGIKSVLAMTSAPPKGSKPWMTDNAWNPIGAVPDNPTGTFLSAVGRLVFFLIVGVMNFLWTVRMSPGARIIVSIVLGLFDLVAVIYLVDMARRMVQAVRVGTPRLAWTRFPFFTGGQLEAVFQTSRAMSPTGPPKVTLRRIEQRSAINQLTHAEYGVSCFEVWSVEQTLPAYAQGPLTSFPISVHVPDDQRGTDLSETDCTYWQIVVQVPVPGPDVEAVFLVPIYDRSK